MAQLTPEQQQDNLEKLLDLIADALILSPFVDTTLVEKNQKFIRNGQLQTDSEGGGVLALFQKDIKANEEDLTETIETSSGETISELQSLANKVDFLLCVINITEGANDTFDIVIEDSNLEGGSQSITDLVFTEGTNPLNVSQFISIQEKETNVDVSKANEFLDTNIYELLPDSDVRQDRINRLFQELNALIPPVAPNFDGNLDGVVDRDNNDNWINAEQYSKNNSISYAQDNPDESNIEEQNAFIHRLKTTANDTNSNTTIEDIYNTIQPYLDDILENPATPEDEREQYRNQSSGYLQFRNLNQGIIVRNTNQEFVQGLDPNNLTYLDTGFTITMWVKFLDKSSEGTLFNFGNPTRSENPFGFKLETYVLDKDDNPFTTSNDYETFGEAAQYIINRDENYPLIYENSNTARFVRLVINDNETIRDSHVGTFGGTKLDTTWIDENSTQSENFRRLQTTFIPEDFQEWYFICATFNPNVEEDDSFDLTGPDGEDYNKVSNFWLNNINFIDNSFVINSELGNRCKVEIISRSDLLRARGFKS